MSEEKTTAAAVEEPRMSNKKEQLGHALGVLGHDSAYTVWATWMTPFLTDVVMLPTAVLGILLAFGRVFDGLNDLFMGSLADRTRSRLGRFRPWILRAGPLFCICMAISFIVPSSNMIVRIIYASVMYLVVDVVFTAVDIPFWSMPAAMTSNPKERSSIIGTTQTTSSAITGVIGIVMPLALSYFGGAGKWSAYFTIASIVAVFGIIMYVTCAKMVKEHVVPPASEKFSLKLGVKSVLTNKPLLCVQICNAVGLLAMIMNGTFNYYYCQYNLGGLEVMSVLSLISTIATVVGSVLFIFLSRYISKKKIMFILAGGYIAARLTHYFSGWQNLSIIFVCSAISGICVGAFMVSVMAMMADTIEYGEWKTGQRNEGMITSTRCFVTKLMMAVSGVIVAFVIGIFGYVPGTEQTLATQNAFHTMMTLVCAGVMLIGIIPMFFYSLTEDKHAQIMEELAARKAARGE
ncbi:MAG: glycoside-pentoside-hexuronide (GPH):cation symporter [Eubacteriales bacterium]|nr:glycoside-pentoside-hexuronide (GPH):cation symporter [Eubacteriales bacterium]